MTSGLTLLGTALKQRDQQTRRQRALTDLYWFETEILGYDKLSPTFHAPMLREWDLSDRARRVGRGGMDDVNLWARDHIKTWCERGRVARYYVADPTWTHTWWHSVEEMAQESAVAVGKTIQFNKEYRKLFAQGVLPSPSAKKFVQASGFTLRSGKIGDAPSMRAWGAGSEATGGHSRGATLDDVIAFNDVMDSQLPAKSRWYKGTVRNVVRSDGSGWVNAIGTRWDRDDLWGEFLVSKHWRKTVRACLETDGVPDYKGEPVYLTKPQIDKKRDEMGEQMFAYQMMNDPAPQGDRPWVPESCERDPISVSDAMSGPGRIVVITDPAPAKIGSIFTEDAASRRGDNPEKNEWTYAVYRFRVNGQRREMILLEIDGSKDWGVDEGFQNVMRAAARWRTADVAPEKTGQAVAFYEKTIHDAARKVGARCHVINLEQTYSGKNFLFGQFCDRAKAGEFLVCESALKRPELQTAMEKLWFQCRNWRPIGKKNSLKLDDYANVASMACDSAFDKITPRPVAQSELEDEENEPAYFGRSRYCAM